MQYPEAIDYLYSRLPVFHRIGPKALKPGLGNTLRLCEALGNPQHRFRSIHVAGTNGKGSTSHMLAAIYQSAGYRVGLYTSPHLKSFTERIRLNGQPIAEDEVAQFVVQHKDLIEAVEPSFFEVTVVLAFDFFARQSVDVAIIEVGLGGRLDSTNVITPIASVITNIGLDHTDILGETLPQIAREKAGIIKPGIPVIISETHPETADVFQEGAQAAKAPLVFADQESHVADEGLLKGVRRIRITRNNGQTNIIELDLTGAYQLKNVVGALTTVAVLQALLPVPEEAQLIGLRSVVRSTGLKGRFQTLQEFPRVIADTAHNQPGISALLTTIYSLPHANLRIVLGLVADKDRSKILGLLPPEAKYYFCQAQTPRSLPAEILQAEAAVLGRIGESFSDVNSALAAALQNSSPEDLILITGSNYIIAELTNL
ncbi:bifunctional folylpolyglutamate synthase/dihydrofolate synthase [Spirosoma taeanense]|uniref:Dihydrofolate synthase/folylpolyglutamate synthase n=1 Tax=Spirosoma taeanense TaxID=2735870 RepID=A0A6M5Y991_9BACT|nr:folylpolyglutamate synthase/dihydrofolate synthase family protein [Spirosoma taeanense]QJW90054.1 bifunctional folylpolyglutamate synthase/dihydrofolate synthase [Spirosoma taeanense]